jgi:penicillin-binding protein 1A
MGIRQRRAHLHSRTHIVGFGIVGAFGFIALFFASLAISLGALVSSWLTELPDYQSADAYLVAEPTQIYAADGTVLTQFYLQERHSVEANQISPYVFTATVDVEDERFYRHNGVDPQGIVRATLSQFMGNSQGASTITQQLVRNTVLSEEQFDRTLRRKVREAYIAIQMEKTYTKDQILLMYVNTIYYGHGAYGIEAAAIKYFNKHASELTLNEAATLVGIPNSPSYYDPTVNMEACRNRRDHVLDRMLEVGDITQEEYDATVAEDITLNLGSFIQEQSVSPYFTDYIRELLSQDFDSDLVLKGGLQVYTTLDLAWQEAAENAVTEEIMRIDDDQLQAGLVAIDPKTGYVRAMVGGRDYNVSQFNMATQARRQTGSSFKMFTLVAALQEGVNPDIYIDCSSPQQITPTWKVQNYGNISYGPMTLTEALAVSSNTAFAQVALGIGAEEIVDVAHQMGIKVDLPAYPSITLGTEGIPPIQMAEGYATLATGGIHRNAVAITRIEDRNGNIVYQHEDNPEQVVSEEISQAATEALEQVILSPQGTAYVVSYTKTFDQPIAGKTGTTEDFRDLWFCAYTPQVSVAIWVGNEDDTPVRVDGQYLHPYNTACPIFVDFANVILDGVSREEFPETGTRVTYRDNSVWDFSVDDNYWADYYAQQEAEAQAQAEADALAQQQEQQQQTDAQGQTTTTGDTGGATQETQGVVPVETTPEPAPVAETTGEGGGGEGV